MAGQGVPKTGVRAIESAERQRKALELRKAGVSFEQIKDALGYSYRSGAHKAVSSAIKELVREPAEEVLALELARIDDALMAIWPLVKKGNLQAIDRFLRLQERRSKYQGLDAPEKRQISGPEGGPIVITAMAVAGLEP